LVRAASVRVPEAHPEQGPALTSGQRGCACAGWVVRSKVLTRGYKYFMMLNSSVRGPFLPPYLVRAGRPTRCRPSIAPSALRWVSSRWCALQGHLTWHRLFTERLSSDVLKVGPTVSCEGTPNRLNFSDIRQNPHVQSYVLALNRVGPSRAESARVPQAARCHRPSAARLCRLV